MQIFETSVPTARIRNTKHFILISLQFHLLPGEFGSLAFATSNSLPSSFQFFCSIFVSHVYYMVTNAVFFWHHIIDVWNTHTHVLVRDCSLFPGSSCKTWVRVRKVVPLSEMCNPHPQTFLAFATVLGKNGKSGSSISVLSVSSFPSTSFLHFIITIPLYGLHLLTSDIDAVIKRKKIPSIS